MSYPQFGHPIAGPFGLVCTIHHLTTPTARITPHAATAATASSDNTNQISSGHVSIPDPRFNSVIIRFDHNVLTNFLPLLRVS